MKNCLFPLITFVFLPARLSQTKNSLKFSQLEQPPRSKHNNVLQNSHVSSPALLLFPETYFIGNSVKIRINCGFDLSKPLPLSPAGT